MFTEPIRAWATRMEANQWTHSLQCLSGSFFLSPIGVHCLPLAGIVCCDPRPLPWYIGPGLSTVQQVSGIFAQSCKFGKGRVSDLPCGFGPFRYIPEISTQPLPGPTRKAHLKCIGKMIRHRSPRNPYCAARHYSMRCGPLFLRWMHLLYLPCDPRSALLPITRIDRRTWNILRDLPRSFVLLT